MPPLAFLMLLQAGACGEGHRDGSKAPIFLGTNSFSNHRTLITAILQSSAFLNSIN